MPHREEPSRVFTRRAAILGGAKAIVIAGLGARMAWLQIAQSRKYTTLAEDNRINLKIIAPERGQIYDRFGVPLAANKQDARITITAENTTDPEASLRALSLYVPLSEKQITRVLKKIEQQPRFTPVEVKAGLSWQQLSKVSVRLPELPGIRIDDSMRRTYPLGPGVAHAIGYVAAVNAAELSKDGALAPAMTLPDAVIGKTGLEKQLELSLRGLEGRAEVEVNAAGREVRQLQIHEGTTGKDLTLTIDAELQLLVQNRLSETVSASAVLMDAKTGAIYALASHPSFDPNLFSYGISHEAWNALIGDPAHPLTDKAIAGSYPPGSTFKMVTALAALASGEIAQNTVVHCPGHLDLGSHRFHCWKRRGHGLVDFGKALTESCDTFFYDIAQKVGIEKIAEMARRLGLDEKTALHLPSEVGGLIPDKAWKRRAKGKDWMIGETILASIGQGYVLTTPMQLAVMTARLLTNTEVQPHLLLKDEQGSFPALGIPDEHLEIVKRGMDRVVNHIKGTAYAARIEEDGYSFGGKTGTSQVRRLSMEDRRAGLKAEDLPWEQQNHALFVGYAPVDTPRYVCSIVVEHGGSGGSVAAPIARDLLHAIQQRQPELRRDEGNFS